MRKVDVESWDSAVAQQYRIRSLPTLWLYEDGQRVASDTREVLSRLQRLLGD